VYSGFRDGEQILQLQGACAGTVLGSDGAKGRTAAGASGEEAARPGAITRVFSSLKNRRVLSKSLSRAVVPSFSSSSKSILVVTTGSHPFVQRSRRKLYSTEGRAKGLEEGMRRELPR